MISKLQKIKTGIYPLSEGSYTIGWDKIFKPFDGSKDSMTDRPASLLVEIQPFLLVTETQNILLDTGLGFYDSDNELVIYNLIKQIGLQPEDIDLVLLSHLHKDHAGAVCIKENSQTRNLFAAFPTAKYYLQNEEWNYAYAHAGSSYDLEILEALKQSGQIELLDGDGKINDEISYEICGGHTPFHQVFRIHANGEKYFYGGDVAPQFSQMQRKFIAKYDFDGKRSAALRKQYTQEGIENDYTFLFFHDLKTPFCKLKMENGMVIKK